MKTEVSPVSTASQNLALLKKKNRMSKDKIYLSRAEQIYLMEMLEIDNPQEAAERFVVLMVMEKADPTQLQTYLGKIMAKLK